MRLIRYTIEDPDRPGHGVEHRLITSLLDPERAPAEELVIAYHSRWEFEVAMDEIKSHQRTPKEPLRSKKAVGVIQEIYGLLIAHYVVRGRHGGGGAKAELRAEPAELHGDAAPDPRDDPGGTTHWGRRTIRACTDSCWPT